jgi:L-alanine-DL-glutamate epimerase-like enolase superfamily enzyme
VTEQGDQRIARIDAWRVRVPALEQWTSSPEFGDHADFGSALIVAVTDEAGVTGWGESSGSPDDATIEAALRIVMGQTLSMQRLSLLELRPPGSLYWQRPAPPSEYHPSQIGVRHRLRHPLQVAVEMAMSDLLARRTGVPVSHLWGGAWRDRVACDYWMGRTTVERTRLCVRRARELGFTGIKLKTTLEDPNVARLEAIAEECGSAFHVTVDPNGRFYRLDDALPTILAMDAVGNMNVLEDAFPRFAPHLTESAELRRRIRARIAIHIDPPESLWQVIISGAAGALNLDSAMGIFGWRAAAAVADAANLPIWHGSGLNLGLATACQLHLAASAPNCQLPGDQCGPWLRESHLLQRGFEVFDGHIKVPTGPGLGVDIDMNELDKYTTRRFTISP